MFSHPSMGFPLLPRRETSAVRHHTPTTMVVNTEQYTETYMREIHAAVRAHIRVILDLLGLVVDLSTLLSLHAL